MELGYLTFPMHPPGSLHHETIQHDLDQIVTLDKLGFQEAWIGEHFTASWENIPSPDLFIAAALGLTENIILGTGVTCLPNHNPFVLANRIAQLDQMAKGRFHWGIGSGGFPSDFEVFGFDHENGENKTMTREALDCILGIWDDPKPGNYKSKWWNLISLKMMIGLESNIICFPFRNLILPLQLQVYLQNLKPCIWPEKKGTYL
jgi:alkanesulfonate monooxygenase SsuD/methylene tetrahydromethanopterin reductase-like flavin-dependent oxidoreductase (luciferase family)